MKEEYMKEKHINTEKQKVVKVMPSLLLIIIFVIFFIA